MNAAETKKVALNITFSRPRLVKDEPVLPQERAKPVPLGCIRTITIRLMANTNCKIMSKFLIALIIL